MKDGGQAFPTLKANISQFPDGSDLSGMMGMTLRDYFAAKAMASMIRYELDHVGSFGPTIACTAYDIADAMLKAREQ